MDSSVMFMSCIILFSYGQLVTACATFYQNEIKFLIQTPTGISMRFIYSPPVSTTNIKVIKTTDEEQYQHYEIRSKYIVDFDADDDYIFWSESQEGKFTLCRKNINNTENMIVTSRPYPINSLAVYPPTKLVYFVEDYKWIKVIDYDGNLGVATLYSLLDEEHLHKTSIINLFVAYHYGKLVFLEQSMDINSTFEVTDTYRQLSMDGNTIQYEKLYTESNSLSPVIGYNPVMRQAYWLSQQNDPGKYEYLFYSPISFPFFSEVYQDNGGLVSTVYVSDMLFYVSTNSRVLQVYSNACKKRRKRRFSYSEKAEEIILKIVPLYEEKWLNAPTTVTNSSDIKSCSHFTLLQAQNQTFQYYIDQFETSVEVGSSCKCSDDYVLNDDGATCKKSIQKSNGEFIKLVLIGGVTGSVILLSTIAVALIVFFFKRKRNKTEDISNDENNPDEIMVDCSEYWSNELADNTIQTENHYIEMYSNNRQADSIVAATQESDYVISSQLFVAIL